MQYKTQISHFGQDSAFKRVFSGFGYEAHHHGHQEMKFRANYDGRIDKQMLNTITFDNSLFKSRETKQPNDEKTP